MGNTCRYSTRAKSTPSKTELSRYLLAMNQRLRGSLSLRTWRSRLKLTRETQARTNRDPARPTIHAKGTADTTARRPEPEPQPGRKLSRSRSRSRTHASLAGAITKGKPPINSNPSLLVVTCEPGLAFVATESPRSWHGCRRDAVRVFDE
jgi:hypothetical protein